MDKHEGINIHGMVFLDYTQFAVGIFRATPTTFTVH
jgi:hypothetical protein